MSRVNLKIGDYVYLKTDIGQYKRIITGYTVRTDGVTYLLSLGSEETAHYELEISNEVDTLLKSIN
tara:strand:- start:1213 stop:1410 length:198 start_codon:yes stop_codon:yes gene_type:complete